MYVSTLSHASTKRHGRLFSPTISYQQHTNGKFSHHILYSILYMYDHVCCICLCHASAQPHSVSKAKRSTVTHTHKKNFKKNSTSEVQHNPWTTRQIISFHNETANGKASPKHPPKVSRLPMQSTVHPPMLQQRWVQWWCASMT